MLTWPISSQLPQPSAPFTPVQLSRLRQALAPLHEQYDVTEHSLRLPFHSPGYHTTLTGGFTHPTRESLGYALSLLDSGEPRLHLRAQDILRRVIAAQDQNAANSTYGIWPWFLEEPLSRMNPPDWNWADFCGVELVQVARSHRDRLDAALAERLDESIDHAAHSIMQRDVGPHYTNIVVMGAYVTLVSAELYGKPAIREYALRRIRRFHQYTLDNGGFTEFNSPTYTIVLIRELGRLCLHTESAEVRELVNDLYHRAWREVTDHFHVASRQWAGPHSRCYSTLLTPEHAAMLERSIASDLDWGIAANHPTIDEHRLPTPCPPDLVHAFFPPVIERQTVSPFQKGPPPQIGTTWFTNDFALGSVNRGDLWTQRRSLIAYWGTQVNPCFLRLRCLHDGQDFATAQFFSVQKDGDILAGINFATNGGDTHLLFDPLQNGQFTAVDLRIRFEIGGSAIGETTSDKPDITSPVRLSFNQVEVEIGVLHAQFADQLARWEMTRDGEILWLDLVLYAGPARPFSFVKMDSGIGFYFRMSSVKVAPSAGTARVGNRRLSLNWNGMSLSFPIRSDTVEALQNQFTSSEQQQQAI